MSSTTPTVRSYLSENEHQYLIDQIRTRTEGQSLVEQRDPKHEKWLDESPGEGGILALPLHALPFVMPEGWIKSALLTRHAPGYSIRFKDSDSDVSVVKRLRSDLKVYSPFPDIMGQCLQQFPNWIAVDNRDEAQAELILTSVLEGSSTSVHFDFDPIEIIPRPASGVICLVCPKDNMDSIRWARQFMDRETGMCSNLERELLQLQTEQRPEARLYAFSRKTDIGYESAVALDINGQWFRTLETISSTAGAAQMIWEDLLAKIS